MTLQKAVPTLELGLMIKTALTLLCLSMPHSAFGAERGALPSGNIVPPPYGAIGLCDRHPTLCEARSETSRRSTESLLSLANRINIEVNRNYPQRSDIDRFGEEEFWAPVDLLGGDCEDFALKKKLELLDEGVSFSRLRIATVLDTKRDPHAVLVVNINGTDMVLDNLTDDVVPWHATDYIFLRTEDPTARGRWRMAVGPKSLNNI